MLFDYKTKFSPVFEGHWNNIPLGDGTTFYHLNIGLVRNSDPHCTRVLNLVNFTPESMASHILNDTNVY